MLRDEIIKMSEKIKKNVAIRKAFKEGKVRKYDDLPANCKKYLKFIEEYTKTRISLVSVGPDRENNIIINEL